MASPEASKILPPYVPYKTFATFMDGLRIALPGQIDRSVMPTFSGAMQGQLLNALRYLGFIDEDGIPSVVLYDLMAQSNQDEIKSAHRTIIKSSYAFLFNNFTLATATPRMLDQVFATTGAQGDTVRKCIAFFLMYAKANDLPMSPHLKAPKTRASGARRKRTNGATHLGTTPITTHSENVVVPKPMPQLLLDILDVSGVSEAEEQAVWTLIKFLKKQGREGEIGGT